MERIGRTVGSYRIVERVGEGGMGTVYRALDLMLDREVALKAVRPELAREPHIIERFRSEAKTLARIHHPAIATIYSFFADGDELFLAMEFVRGTSLAEVIRNAGAVPWERAVPLFCTALEGIEQVHRLGIIHRDLKPDNLMITEEGAIKVMDFGIARAIGSDRLTRTGLMMGTLRYMPPEQLRGEEADRRSDVYGLGTVLFEMLTGRVPFGSESEYEIIRAQVEDAPPPPGSLMPGLPEWIDRAVLRALAKDPADRFQTAEQFRAFLATAGLGTHELAALPTVVKPRSGARSAASKPAASAASDRPLVTAAGSYGPPAVGRPRRLAWAAGLAALLIALVLGVWAARGQRESPPVPPKPAAAPARTPPAPAPPRQAAASKPAPPPAMPSEMVRTLPDTAPVPPSRPRPVPLAPTAAAGEAPRAAAPPPAEPPTPAPSSSSAEGPAGPPLTSSELQELGRAAAQLEGATDRLAQEYGHFVQQKKAGGQQLTASEQQLQTLLAAMLQGAKRFSNRVDQGLSTWPKRLAAETGGTGAAEDRRTAFQRHARQLGPNGQRVNRLLAQVQPGAAVEEAWQEVRRRTRRVVEILGEAGKTSPP